MGVGIGGVVEDLGGVVVFDDVVFVYYGDFVGEVVDGLDVVGDEDYV